MIPDSEKIIFIESPGDQIEMPLEKMSLLLGRSDGKDDWKPDINLVPDFRVSRKHAHLFFENGHWWIEDLNSRHGILVGQKEISGLHEATQLSPGVCVCMGNTVWMIATKNQVIKRWEEFIIQFEKVPAVNYALYNCGIPIISNLTVKNKGASTSSPLELTITIKGYSAAWQTRLDPIPPGETIALEKIHLDLDYEKLEGNEGRKKAQLRIRLNNAPVFEEAIHILGFFEWPTDTSFRKSLACFVQPSHPIVQNIVLDAVATLEKLHDIPSFTHLIRADLADKADYALEALYETLKEEYEIHYVLPPSSFEHDSQVIRPPHRVLSDTKEGMGKGTCIDLALMLASCLENIHLQPLIIFVEEEENTWHALVGCWKQVTERFEPILTNKERFKEIREKRQIVAVETTGFSDRFGKKLRYTDAVEKAEEILFSNGSERFLFALDVAASRQTVVPLQFPMSTGVIDILRNAEAIARKEGSGRLETRHLLFAVLRNPGKDIDRILEEAGCVLAKIRSKVSFSMSFSERTEDTVLRPTINYCRLLEDAKLIASDSDSKFTGKMFVEKPHLFFAILLSQSESVDRLFREWGTDRFAVKKWFENRFFWTKDVVETYYEPS